MNASGYSEPLAAYCNSITEEFALIPEDRVQILNEIGDYILQELMADRIASLLFICTHNSRRSQLGQIWALTAADYYSIGKVRTFSGGTVATAFNPGTVASLERAGFSVEVGRKGTKNPVYTFNSGKTFASGPMRSKKYTSRENPSELFCAVMVCSQADAACPFVPGASKRIVLPYTDPQVSDGTPQESNVYDDRCRQICREMFRLMHYVKSGIF